MRHIIIGDVHGMANELAALIDLVNPGPRDQIVFVGDLVDKGPDSADVVKFVRSVAQRHDVVLVEGNHEDKHRRFRRNVEVRPEVAAGMVERQPELADITDALEADDVAFMDAAVPFHRIHEHGVLVVHGGIPGDMVDFPATVEEAQTLGGKRKKKFANILRTRYVGVHSGKMLQLGANGPDDPFWADVYDGRFGHVVFGHEPMKGDVPGEFAHATGIDTGAVFGGTLTAMVIDAGGGRSFVSVPGRPMANRFHC